MYLALANFPGVRSYGVESIKACLSGSDPLPVEVQEQFEKLTRGRVIEGYGLTEASPATHVNPMSGQRRTGSIGLPLPSTEVRIMDLKTGRETVDAGHLGEMQVRGPQVMLGYWKDPEETARVLDEKGWLRTGDVAMMDEDGYFRIVARKADMWIPEHGDDPAFPRDVEEVLYEVPTVKEVAVVAVARQPIGFVIPRDKTPEAEELIEYCRRRLPAELVPKLIVFVDDFPRTFIGKILRRELAKRFEEQQEGSQKG
jgi:long-chain acyl-CoA synthetase